jgi:hypothetical protein
MDIGKIIEIGEVDVRRPEEAPGTPRETPKEKPVPVPATPG